MSERRNNILFFDCETGGLDPRQASIIEVAAVLTSSMGEHVLKERAVKVVPVKPVHPRAAAVNGYSAEKWAGAISLAEAIGEIVDLSAGALFAAHNAPFDWAFLQDAMGSLGLRWRGGYHKIDTVSLAMPLFMAGLVPDLKLSTLAKHFVVDPGEAHTALSDARACRGIFLQLMGQYAPLFNRRA